jgi:3-phytase
VNFDTDYPDTASAAPKPSIICVLVCSLSLLSACTTLGSIGWSRLMQSVPPAVETDPVPSRMDAADDAAIWINPADATSSLIVATDKQSGLLVYRLDGSRQQFLRLGHPNNVDLRTGAWGNADLTLVAASGRRPSELLLLTLDHATGRLELQRRHEVDLREPYGLCLYQDADREPYVFLNSVDGALVQYAVAPDYTISEVRRTRIRTQPEGCVVDDAEGLLYIGEEGHGIWRMSARPEDDVDRELLDEVRNGHLVADIEGLALYDGPRKLLIASSQGNDSFAVYDVATSTHLASFRVGGIKRIDDVTDTDGIEVTAVSLPEYAHGMLVVQDGHNSDPPENQNFKIVSFSDVLAIIDQEQE